MRVSVTRLRLLRVFKLTLLLTILAHLRRFLGAIGCRMTLLVADAACSLEDTRIGALGFVVSVFNVSREVE